MASNRTSATSFGDKYAQEDRKSIAQLTRGLRRLKRQLLLNQVQPQQDPKELSPVQSLREILVQVAIEDAPAFPTVTTRTARSWSFNEESLVRASSAQSAESLTPSTE